MRPLLALEKDSYQLGTLVIKQLILSSQKSNLCVRKKNSNALNFCKLLNGEGV